MTWFYLTLGSGILISIVSILEKKTLMKEHAAEYSSVIAIMNTLFSIPLLFFVDFSPARLVPLLSLFFIAMLSALGFVLLAKSTRHMEVSSVAPMLNLSTGVTAILAFLVLGEALTEVQIAGIMFLIVGSYVLQTHREDSILEPLKNFINSKYLHFILIAVLAYGVMSLYDRFALSRGFFNPIEYLIFIHIFISIHIVVAMNMFYDGWDGIRKGLRNMHWWAVVISLLTVTQRIMSVFAIQMAYIGLVVAVKHSSSFFTILMAGELFHEKNILRKLLASAILIAGVVLVVIR